MLHRVEQRGIDQRQTIMIAAKLINCFQTDCARSIKSGRYAHRVKMRISLHRKVSDRLQSSGKGRLCRHNRRLVTWSD